MSAALDRSAVAAPARRPRIVHIGLGAFHRAHQAWYTAKADSEWGITAFTGRSATAAAALAPQGGLYTLVTRGPEADKFEVVDSILAAHDGNNLPLLTEKLADPATAILTLTITEAGYRMAAGAGAPRLDLADPAVAADLEELADAYDGRVFAPSALGAAQLVLRTVPARILVGLAARRAGDGWPLAVVSCDNLPNNGSVAEASIVALAEQIDGQLADWIRENVSFVDTSIDRITPRTTGADVATVAAATGFADASPVVTEPFSSWVLCGDFPAGRPDWEKAGAQFVAELEPFERRKLWLLNGAHTLMSFAGQLRGHQTVAQALADEQVSGWVEEFWDAAAAHLQEPELDIPGYRRALRARFENPRIAHHLAQIAMDGSIKLAARALPVYRAERDAGRDGHAALRLIAAWCEQLAAQHAAGTPIADANAEALVAVLDDASLEAGSTAQSAALVAIIDSRLAGEAEAVDAITALRPGFAN
ncbi:mannitol dehydrogenase family protein [Glutamicibacter sp. 0426]|uniref:mannitol dehydrogenase family protein n=1 Tax=Glutamicibacter sp. 0426 TaxID=1913445 RepID=UPI00093D9B9A|nr:mannitol dehydrogenase family protein [Glutamicibacter sp. 0426]